MTAGAQAAQIVRLASAVTARPGVVVGDGALSVEHGSALAVALDKLAQFEVVGNFELVEGFAAVRVRGGAAEVDALLVFVLRRMDCKAGTSAQGIMRGQLTGKHFLVLTYSN